MLNTRITNEFFKDFMPNSNSQTSKKQFGREKYKSYIHSVFYDDEQSPIDQKLLSLARTPNHLCEGLMFPTIINFDSDSMRQHDKMALCVRLPNAFHDIAGIIQLEYVATGE